MTKRLYTTYISLLLTVLATSAQSDSTATSQSRFNIVKWVIDYLDKANDDDSDKPFDVSFIVGPHYSTETKLGLGIIASGNYSTARGDSLTPKSDIALYSNFSITGFFEIGLKGCNIMPRDWSRLTYDVSFEYMPNSFWGIGFKNGINDANETKYDLFRTEMMADYTFKIAKNTYIGPGARLDLARGAKVDGDKSLWEGQPMSTTNFGMGITARYDSRDNLTSPFSGVMLELRQQFTPRFMGNKFAFSQTELTASLYSPVWSGGVIASQIHGNFNYGNVPWGLLATIGGNHRFRGYFKGRFCDKNEMDATVELRQHVWRRNGVVVWGGVASVFPEFSAIRMKQLLPNIGVGYRWEFKKRVNLRVDVGVGRHSKGIIFGVNEAF